MSLLKSIFGQGAADEKASSSLFGERIAIPRKVAEEVAIEPSSKRRKVTPKKKKPAAEEQEADESDKKKQEESANESSEESDQENDEKDEAADSDSHSDSDDDDDDDNEEKDEAEDLPTTAKEDEGAAVGDQADKQNDDEKVDASPTNEDDERTVFVGNLPLSTTRKSLAQLFKGCGQVKSTRLRSAPIAGVKLPQTKAGNQDLVRKVCTNTQTYDTTLSSFLQGYVVFQSKDSVTEALKMNHQIIKDSQGTIQKRRLRVDVVNPTLDVSLSVFVGNLPYQADEQSLMEHFVKGCGFNDVNAIERVRLIRDKETFQCKGFGYVNFRDRSMVVEALQKMNETIYKKRPLRVKVCGKTTKGRKGKPSPKELEQRRVFEGKRATATGAFRRLVSSANSTNQGKKRKRGEKKVSSNKSGRKPGVSRRDAIESKVEKRVKKLEKRIRKGMGKARKG